MTRTELVKAVAEKTGATQKDTAIILQAAFEMIGDKLSEGDEVRISDFGTFKVAERAARKGRNPHTGEEIDIKASKNATFRSARALRTKVNG